jgi:RNase P/RNase MRP subunit p29
MNSEIQRRRVWIMLGMGVLLLSFTVSVFAQVKSETSTKSGTQTQEVSVERGEVLHVSGNDLIMKMEDGTIRHFPNVSENARATVDGKEIGIRDLKPGMRLQRTITVTTTPQIVTTVQTVTGTVWHVSPPSSVTLTLEDGTNQQFKIPKGQTFMVDGQPKDAWGLKKGMKVSATKIVEEPVNLLQSQSQVTGSMPPPPPAPPADAPILVAVVMPPPAPAKTPVAPATLPKTGSFLPLIGLLGGLSLLISIALRAIRHVSNQ